MPGLLSFPFVESVRSKFQKLLQLTSQRTQRSLSALSPHVPLGLLFAIVAIFFAGCSSNSAAPMLASIDITSSSSSAIIVSTNTTLTATAKDSRGHILNGVTFTWTSSAPTVATIGSSSGTAMGLLAGATQITASANGVMSPPFTLNVTPGFLLTGGLGTPRNFSTATLLNNGMVLIAGGNANLLASDSLTSAELYNPTTGTFTPTGSMNVGHNFHTATLLDNGKVLIAGGITDNNAAISTAELYDPATGTFSLTGNMNSGRYFHTATLLQNGTVLMASGIRTNTAEIYDPSTGTFSPTGSMTELHEGGAAVLLNDGKVLVAGGLNATGYTATSELFDPAVGAFTLTGSMKATRDLFTATLLNNGKVLVAGGVSNGVPSSGAELYDPATGVFTPTGSLNSAHFRHSATLLTNGTVLITGGDMSSISVVGSAELYDPSAGTFAMAGSLNTTRAGHTATLLANGTILIVGGTTSEAPKAGEEIYEPGSLTLAGLQSITVTPANASISSGSRQRFIAMGTLAGSTQQLASVVWTSSVPATALISNDISNRGSIQIVSAPAAITPVTVTAAVGPVTGSATLNVNP